MVRSFHYRKRRIFALTEVIQTVLGKFKRSSADDAFPNVPTSHKCSPAFPFTKKVITNEAKATFRYNRYDKDPDSVLVSCTILYLDFISQVFSHRSIYAIVVPIAPLQGCGNELMQPLLLWLHSPSL